MTIDSHPSIHQEFNTLARAVENRTGSPYTFLCAVILILVWAITGPWFNWSDTWQLVINTGTTIVTFLMVFLIQATQTRDTRALHLKIDELIRVTDARNRLILAPDMDDKELAAELDRMKEVAANG